MLISIPVLGAIVLTLNWEPAAFFCKSDVDPADQGAGLSKSRPERSNLQIIIWNRTQTLKLRDLWCR